AWWCLPRTAHGPALRALRVRVQRTSVRSSGGVARASSALAPSRSSISHVGRLPCRPWDSATARGHRAERLGPVETRPRRSQLAHLPLRADWSWPDQRRPWQRAVTLPRVPTPGPAYAAGGLASVADRP